MKEEYNSDYIKDQRALVGEFVMRFENLNDWMRHIIPMIICENVDSKIQVRNIETLLADVTSEQLRSKFESLIFDNFSAYPKFINANKVFFKRTSDISKIRNSIVHGSYRLGWMNFVGEVSAETFSLRHSKATKGGYEKRSKIISNESLINLNGNLQKMGNSFNHIAVIVRLIMINKIPDKAQPNIKQFAERVLEQDKLELKHLDILN